MDGTKTALERAFEMATAGEVSNITDLRSKMKAEGYASQQVEGPALARQLRALIEKAKNANRT